MSRTKTPTATPALAAVPRETRHEGDDGVAVIMPRDRARGVRAFGALRPGVEYVVAPAEAVRLVRAKGFTYSSEEDARRAGEWHAAQQAPLAEPIPAVAAPDATRTED